MNTEQENKEVQETSETEIKTETTQEKQDVEIFVTGFTLFGQVQ